VILLTKLVLRTGTFCCFPVCDVVSRPYMYESASGWVVSPPGIFPGLSTTTTPILPTSSPN